MQAKHFLYKCGSALHQDEIYFCDPDKPSTELEREILDPLPSWWETNNPFTPGQKTNHLPSYPGSGLVSFNNQHLGFGWRQDNRPPKRDRSNQSDN